MTTGSTVWASRAARASAAVVASGAAALSFRATSQVAETSGAVSVGWGWIVPLVVEAGVLTAAALAWVRSGEGLRATTETVVMTGLLMLSVVINVAHASRGTVLGRVMAAVPPVVLLVAVEGLLREQRRTAARQETTVDQPPVRASTPPAPAAGEDNTADNGTNPLDREAPAQDRPASAAPVAEVEPEPPRAPAEDIPADAVADRPDASVAPAAVPASPEPVRASIVVPPAAATQPTGPSPVHQPVETEAPNAAPWMSAIERQARAVATTPADAAPTVTQPPPAEPATGGTPRTWGRPAEMAHPPLTVIDGPFKPEDLAGHMRRAYRAGSPVNGRTVANWLGVSESTGKRRLKKVLADHPDLTRYAARDDETLNRAN